MSATKDPVAWFREQFEQRQAAQSAQEPAWLGTLRENAWRCFAEAGFPNKKYEEWKYISVAGLVKDGYTIASEAPAAFDKAALDALGAAYGDHRMVFVDGIFQAELSSLPTVPDGGTIGSLAVALKGPQSDDIQQQLARLLDSRVKNPFAYLNMAMFRDGAYIDIPRDASVEGPIELVMVSSGKEATPATHPRHMISVGDGARLDLIERYVGAESGSTYWSNVATSPTTWPRCTSSTAPTAI